jgi:Right handed beta helix region
MSTGRTRLSSSHAAIILGIALALMSELAQASAQRTFVASFGNDANAARNCSLVLPCRSFATAITQTLDGGEIVVLDSAGYAPVTIDRSVSITAPDGVYAGVTVSGAIGVTIAGNLLQVVLRGLTINSLDTSGVSGAGISVLSSNTSRIHVERVFISGFAAGIEVGGSSGGVRFEIADSTIQGCEGGIVASGDNLVMIDRIRINGLPGGTGIAITGAVTSVRDSVIEGTTNAVVVLRGGGPNRLPVTIEGSTLRNNANGLGFRLTGTPTADGIAATVSNTVVSGNFGRGINIDCDMGTTGVITIADSVVSNNLDTAIYSSGGTCSVAVSHSVISGNSGTSMINAGSGSFVTFGDNRIYGNNPDTPSGTITLVPSR